MTRFGYACIMQPRSRLLSVKFTELKKKDSCSAKEKMRVDGEGFSALKSLLIFSLFPVKFLASQFLFLDYEITCVRNLREITKAQCTCLPGPPFRVGFQHSRPSFTSSSANHAVCMSYSFTLNVMDHISSPSPLWLSSFFIAFGRQYVSHYSPYFGRKHKPWRPAMRQ